MTTIYTKGGYLGSGASSDKLVALDGPAHLDGGAGSDNINGGKGDDILQGGKGNDYMYGGAGKDTFLWLATDVRWQHRQDLRLRRRWRSERRPFDIPWHGRGFEPQPPVAHGWH